MKSENPSRSRPGPRSVVLKVGGANLERPEYVERLAEHVRTLEESGTRVVLVHGGGPQIGAVHDSLGIPFREVDGLRVTSPATLDITIQVLSGVVNKRLVTALTAKGLRAIGLSGIDLHLLRARLVDERTLGRVGAVERVDAQSLHWLLGGGCVVVLAPVSLAEDGEAVNVNADAAAHAVATAMGVEQLDFVSDVPGVRTEADSEDVADRIHVPEARRLVDEGVVVRGGMIPKLRAAIEAVEGGVQRVRVGTLAGMSNGRATEVVA